MKKKLFMFMQILVSVVILTYLGNSIFERQATEALLPIATKPEVSDADQAREFRLTADQVALIRAHCIVPAKPGVPATINLKPLPLLQRVPIVWKIGPHGLGSVFSTVDPIWFVCAILLFGVICLLGVMRWRLILQVQGLDIGFSRAASIFFIGHFFNAFMLGSTGGDVIKAWYVAHETHHKKAEAVTTVLMDRVIGLLALLLIALIMMGIFHEQVLHDKRLVGFGIFTLLVVLGAVAGTVLGLWKGFADKIPGLRWFLTKLPQYEMLCRITNAYRLYASHPSVLIKTLVYSFGVHLSGMISIMCVARGLGITVHVVDFLLYLPIITSLSSIPISFSGFGVREGLYVEMFAQTGMPAVQALALSLLGYIVSLLWSLVGGIFFLTHRKEMPSAAVVAQEE